MSFDFSIGDEQRGFLDTVDRFMARHLPPEEIRRRDREHVPPYDILPAMGDAGLLSLPIPVEHGGLGRDWRDVALVQLRLGERGYMAASIFNRVIGFGAMSLLT
jgi:alkylation response protein AidB-like acyl-CoA dehydrogenase